MRLIRDKFPMQKTHLNGILPNETSNTKEENRDYDVYAISSEDQKRITEKYGMGPDPTGNREKALKIAAQKYANRNLGY